jgi:hypothetical protein
VGIMSSYLVSNNVIRTVTSENSLTRWPTLAAPLASSVSLLLAAT